MENTKDIIKKIKDSGKNIIVFSDTETTGVEEEDRIIQIAYAIYSITEKNTIEFFSYKEEYIKAPLDIKPGAAAVHGIWKEDLKGSKSWEKSESKKDLELLEKEGAYICFHNSPFDITMLEKENIFFEKTKVIDTLRIARHIFKNDNKIESKGLQWLRYYFDFDSKKSFKKIIKDFGIDRLRPHTALSDIVVLIYFYDFISKKKFIKSLSESIDLSLKPILEDKISFGKVFEKGTLYSEVITSTYEQFGKKKKGISYLNWAMKNMETLSFDQKYAISYFTLEAIKKGDISIADKETSPMILFAAAFIPEFKDFLNKKGFDTNKQKAIVNESIKKKIELLYNSKIKEDKEKAIKLKKEYDFFSFYLNYIQG